MNIFIFLLLLVSTLEAKVVLITGASRGIGLKTAEHLTSLGHTVYATNRKELDVTDDASIQRTLETIMQKEGRLDVLINNAGIAVFGPFELVTIEQAQRVFDVNFFGAMRVMQQVLPIMRKQNSGLIINMSSTSGVRPSPGWDVYGASKFALEGLSEAARAMAHQWNIDVVVVEPGTCATHFFTESTEIASRKNEDTAIYDTFMPNAMKWMEERLAAGQNPEEVAAVIATVIATDKPKMRYQTSVKGTQTVAKLHCDPTGETSTREQELLLEPLWRGGLDPQIGSSFR
ncbi:MAG: SDR family oxidoreductase [Verrucomicrobia bacterium]|nr:SDR family oxidoreductase [Verrucomicrobiota bacterium]MBS0635984.1 SDR family oxidoreductase [Verrucomicrobiota bacterium]